MRYRMAAAVLSLGGFFLSLYLYLHKIGVIGELACGTGGCEKVQFSSFGRFLGLDVPLIGMGGYLSLLGACLAALQRPDDPRWPRLLLALSVVGVAFTAYLKYVEFFVLHALCRWCVASAVFITLILILALLDRRSRIGPATRDADLAESR
ncbi:MAG TPA: vitamin K epoxide reductase family protein [Gemmatimonadales bacterium]|nr:vitamin K epoxide reductase family protein [Gemmatimonadales bacterium]